MHFLSSFIVGGVGVALGVPLGLFVYGILRALHIEGIPTREDPEWLIMADCEQSSIDGGRELKASARTDQPEARNTKFLLQ